VGHFGLGRIERPVHADLNLARNDAWNAHRQKLNVYLADCANESRDEDYGSQIKMSGNPFSVGIEFIHPSAFIPERISCDKPMFYL